MLEALPRLSVLWKSFTKFHPQICWVCIWGIRPLEVNLPPVQPARLLLLYITPISGLQCFGKAICSRMDFTLKCTKPLEKCSCREQLQELCGAAKGMSYVHQFPIYKAEIIILLSPAVCFVKLFFFFAELQMPTALLSVLFQVWSICSVQVHTCWCNTHDAAYLMSLFGIIAMQAVLTNDDCKKTFLCWE